MTRWGVIVAAAIAGCGSPVMTESAAPPSPSTFAVPVDAGAIDAAAEPSQTVAVRYLPGDDAWEVTWRFAAPTPGIVFDRMRPSNRHETWIPGPGLVWGSDHGYETLRGADGAPRRELSARFATDDRSPGRAPPLNLRFSDGGRLLFTAQVAVHALVCDGGACDRRDRGGGRVWHLAGAPDDLVRVLGEAAAGAVTWHEPPGDVRGTYVYVGRTEAVAATGATLLLDPGLPRWLADETRARLPELVAFHAERTGLALDLTPLILVSYDGTTAGDAMRGRTLPGLLQLDADGRGWRHASADGRSRWFELIAHESFHLWNAQLARRNPDQRDEWLSEGSAVYVAGLALHQAGLLDRKAQARRIAGAANACIGSLRGGLRSAEADASYYVCGELVMFVIDQALADRGGVHGLLAATFAVARDRGSYGTDDFLALLAARTDDAVLLADVHQILDRGLGAAPALFVQRRLAAAGLATRVVRGRLRLR